MISCCGKDPVWVENIPGKGYNFCTECRKEVLEPLAVEEKPTQGELIDEAIEELYGFKPASIGYDPDTGVDLDNFDYSDLIRGIP